MNRILVKVLLIILFLFPFVVNAKDNKVTLYVFHGDGCPHCKEEIKYLRKEKFDDIDIIYYEVWHNDENAELLQKVYDAYNVKSVGVPTTVIGNTIITGFGDTTGPIISRAVDFYKKNDYVDNVSLIINGAFDEDKTIVDEFSEMEFEKGKEVTVKLPIFGKVNLRNASLMSAAVIIGLIDGFNPCAMWVLLFLIGSLIGMKNKKRMWILGLSFLLTSAFVYMLIMLSWVTIVVKITTIVWIRNIIAIIALIGGLYNLRSFLNSRDSGCEVVDDKKRKTMFDKIKKFTEEKSFIIALLGVVGLAISVNVVELACSAGLPLVFTELLAINNVSSFMRIMYTLLYILFFLIDDLVVFFIAMFTMKLTGISTKYNKYSHLLGGVIMIMIGVLLITHPEWLMFQFS